MAYIPKPGTPFTVSATTVAAALTSIRCVTVVVQADPDNSVSVFLGDATDQVVELVANSSMTIPCTNANQIYVKTASSTADVNVWPLH